MKTQKFLFCYDCGLEKKYLYPINYAKYYIVFDIGPSTCLIPVCQPHLDTRLDTADDNPELEPHRLVKINAH